jgi:hypothetical protein
VWTRRFCGPVVGWKVFYLPTDGTKSFPYTKARSAERPSGEDFFVACIQFKAPASDP